MKGFFITGTGTGVGKTHVTLGLVRALRASGHRAIALKPVETGVTDGHAADASLLAEASDAPWLADAAGFHRGRAPLSPLAAGLAGEPLPPAPPILAEAVRDAVRRAAGDIVLVEGAGGVLVPLDAAHDIADLASALRLPLVLVAVDALGTLSHTLTAHAALRLRGLDLAAVVLNRPPSVPADPSMTTNGRIIADRLGCPVVTPNELRAWATTFF